MDPREAVEVTVHGRHGAAGDGAAGADGGKEASRADVALPPPAPDAEGTGNGQRPPPAITVAGLTKNYGEIEAVRGIDFEVPTGETFGFLGPNGAGKSTTIKILCTLARPTSGSARVAGHDVTAERDAVRRNIGLVFLDEPTVGLDPQTRTSIWEYINELKAREDITIFLTTHYMDEAEHCDRIAIIDHGKIVAIDTPEALKASVGKDRVQIHTADDAAAIAQLGRDFGIEAAVHEGAVTFSVASGEEFVPRLFAGLSVPIRAVSVSRPSLDDVFMSYTGKTIRDAEAGGADAMRQIVAHMRGRR